MYIHTYIHAAHKYICMLPTSFLCLNPVSLFQVPSDFSIYELLEKTVIETNQFEDDKNVRQMSALPLWCL